MEIKSHKVYCTQPSSSNPRTNITKPERYEYKFTLIYFAIFDITHSLNTFPRPNVNLHLHREEFDHTEFIFPVQPPGQFYPSITLGVIIFRDSVKEKFNNL